MTTPVEGTNGGSRPIVLDPSALTTAQLLREIGGLHDLMFVRLADFDRLTQEKFESVDKQLDLIERQRVEQKKDTKDAVDAALTAQKEAVKEQTSATDKAIAKTEASTAEQLKQLALTFVTAIKGTTDGIDDLKERVAKMEATRLGMNEQRNEHRAANGAIYAAVGFIVSLLLAAMVLIPVLSNK